MAFLPVDPEYGDYLKLRRILRRDGEPVALDDIQVGDFVYVSDGPRIITALGEHYGDFRAVGLADTGGPITGGWMNLYEPGRGRYACRGGHDHILARVDTQETQVRRLQRAGHKHPTGRRRSR